MIKHETVEMEEGFNEFVNSAEWKKLLEKHCSSGFVRVFHDVREFMVNFAS